MSVEDAAQGLSVADTIAFYKDRNAKARKAMTALAGTVEQLRDDLAVRDAIIETLKAKLREKGVAA